MKAKSFFDRDAIAIKSEEKNAVGRTSKKPGWLELSINVVVGYQNTKLY